jgi:DnaJ family protein A protein 2
MTRQKPKPPPTKQPVNVSLADLYTGKDIEVKVRVQAVCNNCQGRGASNPDAIKRCQTCQGKGQVNQIRQIGPGMLQQSSMVCPKCAGKGKTIENPKDICKPCNGERVSKLDKTINVKVTPGMKFGDIIPLHGMGDEYPDVEDKEDLLIIIVETYGVNHSNLRRNNNDLHMEYDLSLIEALIGFKLIIHQLDGRKLVINYDNKVIQPKEIMKISGEGMPFTDSPHKKGDLYVHFNVILPKTIDNPRKDVLKQILPIPKRNNQSINESSVMENKKLEEVRNPPSFDFNNQNNTTNNNQNNTAYSDYEYKETMKDINDVMGDFGGGAPNGVQCAQQ